MHNSLWGLEGDAYTECRIAGYIGAFTFSNGSTSKFTFVIVDEGFFYPVRHSTIAGALIDTAVRQRIRKQPLPRLV